MQLESRVERFTLIILVNVDLDPDYGEVSNSKFWQILKTFFSYVLWFIGDVSLQLKWSEVCKLCILCRKGKFIWIQEENILRQYSVCLKIIFSSDINFCFSKILIREHFILRGFHPYLCRDFKKFLWSILVERFFYKFFSVEAFFEIPWINLVHDTLFCFYHRFYQNSKNWLKNPKFVQILVQQPTEEFYKYFGSIE